MAGNTSPIMVKRHSQWTSAGQRHSNFQILMIIHTLVNQVLLLVGVQLHMWHETSLCMRNTPPLHCTSRLLRHTTRAVYRNSGWYFHRVVSSSFSSDWESLDILCIYALHQLLSHLRLVEVIPYSAIFSRRKIFAILTFRGNNFSGWRTDQTGCRHVWKAAVIRA